MFPSARPFAALAAIGVQLVAATVLPAQKPAPIKFARYANIANDGRIAFTYQDDIWVADAGGGNPQRLTVNIARDIGPRFSPDGKWIAFTSNRNGNNDVYVVPSTGGEPRELTWYSGDDQALGWTPDGTNIIISSARGPDAWGSPLYRLPLDGSPPVAMGMAAARAGTMNQDATMVAYNRGLPSAWRKGFKGNATANIAVQDVRTGQITEITHTDLQKYRDEVSDVYPMWGADGMIYFASERDGSYNIWRMSPKGGAPAQVTHHKDGVFYPSMSPDGKKLVYQMDFDLWTVDVPSGQPRKLAIPLAFDPKENDIDVLTSTNRADGFAPSPDGNYVALDMHGDIRVVPAEQGIGENISVAHTAWKETSQEYSPDGKKIAYVSDESGDQEVWVFDVATGERRKLTTQPSEKGDINWAANSQKLAYVAANRIWEVDVAGGVPRELAHNVAGGFNLGQYVGDGTWLLYSRRDAEQNADIYLYDIAAKREYNVTRSPATENAAAITPDGKTVIFSSNRDGAENQLFSVSLAKLTEDMNDPLVRERLRRATGGARGGRGGGATDSSVTAASRAPSGIDLNGIERRAIQLTRGADPVGAFFLSADGRTIYFTVTGGSGAGGRGGRGGGAAAADDQSTGLFAMGLDGRDRRRLAGGTFPALQATWDRKAVFFRGTGAPAAGETGSGSEVHKITLAAPARNDRVNFTFEVRVNRREEWKQMFNETWRVMKYRYYDEKMNNHDWAAIKAKYEPLLQYVGTNEDVYDLGNAMIGEMNSSHTGVSGPPTHVMPRVFTTRSVGFEMEPAGSRYKISHIYRGGPADKEWLGLSVGDYVLAIDGQELTTKDNYWKILSTTTNEYIPVKVAKSATGEGARVVRIASVTNLGNIKYEEWVENNRDIVEKATGGQIAYVHIRAMDAPSLARFQNEIDRFWNRKGIIVDIRNNGGGNIDQELIDILERRPYEYWNGRNGDPAWGRRPRQAIAGPKVMMVNGRSASDAEVTPLAFRQLGLGRIVGNPTSAQVIATGSYALINGGAVRTPGALVVTYDPSKPNNYGINLENYGVAPDVWVKNSPMDEVKGVDRELQAAIEEVMRMLKAGVVK